MSGELFSTRILDQVKKEKRKLREAVRVEVLDKLKIALSESPVTVREAIVFGSLAKPYTFSDYSDLDVAIHSMNPRVYLALKCYLEGKLGR